MIVKELCEECFEYLNKSSRVKHYETNLPFTKGICPICNNGNTLLLPGKIFITDDFLRQLKIRPLSARERNELSLELRCCFYLTAWNKSKKIKSVDDWVNYAWGNYYIEDFPNVNKEKSGRKLAREEVNKLIGFAELFYDRGVLDAERRATQQLKDFFNIKE